MFGFSQLYKQMMQDNVISEVHQTCGVLHFLEIREMSWIFFKPGQPL